MTAMLIFHDVAAEAERDRVGFPGPLAARYKHTPEQFGAHLDAIAATGLEIGLLRAPGDRPAAALTFDDGGASVLAIADALERRGWRGHFFVTTERIGTDGFASADEVRALADRGHDVGSHSHTHPTYMARLGDAELAREWTVSRDVLADVLGAPPATAAVPGGSVSDGVVHAVAEAGYRVLMTSEPVARVVSQHGLAVAGRYTLWSTTPPSTAAAYLRGDRLARGRLRAEWAMKRAAKSVAPGAYVQLRRVRAAVGRGER